MTRFQIAIALLLVSGTITWMIARPGKTAGAAENPRTSALDDEEFGYGDNTEDVARHRWQHNAPRHWRSLVVKR